MKSGTLTCCVQCKAFHMPSGSISHHSPDIDVSFSIPWHCKCCRALPWWTAPPTLRPSACCGWRIFPRTRWSASTTSSRSGRNGRKMTSHLTYSRCRTFRKTSRNPDANLPPWIYWRTGSIFFLFVFLETCVGRNRLLDPS